MLFYVFFFKQKTAYEMRISDWSSDVCSSDLAAPAFRTAGHPATRRCRPHRAWTGPAPGRHATRAAQRARLGGGQGDAPRPGRALRLRWRAGRRPATLPRSEEHTSELQSLMRNSYAVFCLHKKNKKHTTKTCTQNKSA